MSIQNITSVCLMKNCRVTNGAVITMKLISITISIVQKPTAILFSDCVYLVIALFISKTSVFFFSQRICFIINSCMCVYVCVGVCMLMCVGT